MLSIQRNYYRYITIYHATYIPRLIFLVIIFYNGYTDKFKMVYM